MPSPETSNISSNQLARMLDILPTNLHSRTDLGYARTPLHIDFDTTRSDVEPDEDLPDVFDTKRFNAIGSMMLKFREQHDDMITVQHKPVLDIDRSCKMESRFGTDRLLIEVGAHRKAKHSPASWLGSILGRLNIGLEIFPVSQLEGGSFARSVAGPYVSTVALTAREVDSRLYFVPSSSKDHGHLYINSGTGIGWDEYRAMLQGFVDIGVIDQDWHDQSVRQGMTIVRTPWSPAPKVRQRS